MTRAPTPRSTRGPAAPAAEHPTLCAAFQATAAARANHVALRTPGDGVRLTWHDYAERVRRIAAGLAALGLRRGDTVALVLHQRPELCCLDTAALHLGVVSLAPYVGSSIEDLSHMLAEAAVRAVVTESALLGRVEQATAGCPTLEHTICIDGAPPGTLSLATVEAAGEHEFELASAAEVVGAGDVAALLYTSGTAGPPKAVEYTHELIVGFLSAFDAVAGREPARCVAYLPFAHGTERVCAHYRTLVRGSTMTLCANSARLAAAVADTQPSYLLAPPLVWMRLMKDPLARRGLGRLRCALSAGAACPPGVMASLHARGWPVRNAYGMTELGFVSISEPDAGAPLTAGRPLPGVEVRLADDREILVRAAWGAARRRDGEAAGSPTDAMGWFATGDVGALDEHGRLEVVDRKADMIISLSGHNASPATIEAALEQASPLIRLAVCIGDGRPYNVALLLLDLEAAWRALAAEGAQPPTNVADLTRVPAIVQAVDAAVAHANERLSDRERVERHALLALDWPAGGDELTPTLKPRRRAIAAKYAAEIDQLYTRP